MTIELVDGPLAGRLHEVEADWPTPDAFGLLNEDKTKRCWYEVQCFAGPTGCIAASYQRSETLTPEQTQMYVELDK